MSAIDISLQRLADGVARLTEIVRDSSERSEADRREMRERLDDVLRMLQEERTILAALHHEIADEVGAATTLALGQHATEERLSLEQAHTAQRHALAGIVQTIANRMATTALAGVPSTAAAGGEATDKHAIVNAHGIPWSTVGKILLALGAPLGAALGAYVHHLFHP